MSDRFVLGRPLGRWQTNCWVIGDRARGTAVVVDPGEHGAQQVPAMLAGAGVRCEAILLTHGHLDHLWAVPDLARTLEVPVLLHPDDRWILDDPAASLGLPSDALATHFGLAAWEPPVDHLRDVQGDTTITFAGIEFGVVHNPGHTPGHVTYLGRGLEGVPVTFDLGGAHTASADVLFSGDLLFAGSVGRTDLPRGSAPAMRRSLAQTVLPLDDDVLVLCGHGPDTTIGHERATNPFLREALANV